MQLLFIFLNCLILANLTQAQSFSWVNEVEYESAAFDFDTFLKTQVDSEGNVFTVINEDIDDDDVDFHLQKRDTDGSLLWTKDWGGSDQQIALATCLDQEGNILILGRFLSTVDFDPNDGVFEVEAEALEWNGPDLFLLKLDNDGNFIWVSTEGPDEDFEGIIGTTIGVDQDNNIIIAGQFEGHFDFGDDHTVYRPAGAMNLFHDNFIVKFNPDGTCLWAKAIDGGEGFSSDALYSIDADDENNIYFAGDFINELDFDPDGVFLLTPTSDNRDGFILKLNENGNFQWVRLIGGGISAASKALKIDSDGNVLCTGYAQGLTDYDPSDDEFLLGSDDSDQHGFILKLNPLGEFIWAHEFIGDEINIKAMDLDTSDQIYLTGAFKGDMSLSPGALMTEVESEGFLTDFFIIKLEENGEFEWGVAIGDTQEEIAEGIVTTSSEEIIVTGRFNGTLDFNPAPAMDELLNEDLTNKTFLLKFDQCNPGLGYDTISSCYNIYWNGVVYTTSTDARGLVYLDESCDSIYYLNYTRFPSYDTASIISSCAPYTWLDGISYDHDTIITLYFENIYGCDSTLFLDFDFIEPVINEDSLNTCTPFTWLDGITYYEDTVLTYTTTTEAGCDSVWIMELIFPGTVYATNVNECYSYTWTDGNTYYVDTLVYDTIVNPFGCDSIRILNLNIHPEETLFNEVSTCISYTWVDGITYTSDTIVTTLISDPFSCDTLATLDLQIIPVDVGITLFSDYLKAEVEDAIYTWLNCDDLSIIPDESGQSFWPDEYGYYAVIIEKDGCIDTSECLLYFIDEASISSSSINNISLFPNPGKGHFTLELPSNESLNIEIVNMEGQLVKTFEDVKLEKFEFELEAESGIYYISVTSPTETHVLKLILL